MSNYHIAKIGDDARLVGIGTLFRRIDDSRWGINLFFSSKQEKTSLTISYAPLLVQGRHLNPTRAYPPSGYKKGFTIKDTTEWQSTDSDRFPARGRLKGLKTSQKCFSFLAEDGVRVFLPHFELARVLFFNDAYLSRLSMEHDVLATEFDIEKKSESVRVNVLPSSGYSLTHFQDPTSRRVLSWILLDHDARRSFESISRHQLAHGYERGQYRLWNFEFTPPPLPKAQLEVRGYYDKETRSMYVSDIQSICNIRADLPASIEFYHPKYERSLPSSRKATPVQQKGAGSSLRDDEAVRLSDSRWLINCGETDVSFDFGFNVSVISDRERERGRVAEEGVDPEENLSTATSLEESSLEGGASAADLKHVTDITEDDHLFLGRFKGFLEMVELLCEKHDAIIQSRQIRPLPQVARYSKHLLSTTGGPRCIAIVTLCSQTGEFFTLIEVDTSDADKFLSTRLIKNIGGALGERDISTVEAALVEKSLQWPKSLLNQLYGKENHRAIPHPSSKCKGALEPSALAGWANRVFGWVQDI